MNHGELCDVSLRELARLVRERRVSAREALQAHLARIDEVNGFVNAVVTLDAESAAHRARRADEQTMRGESLPPLHGVPMTHKDNHDTAGMRTTLGSPAYADRVPTADALIVARLKAAGVVTTGKTNVPELAAGSHTFNPLFGTTTNPWDPTRSSGGSSGGVAAAVAAGIQAAGDGSDMGGSIRTPSSFCNLVGLRPSAGRVPAWPTRDPWAWLSRKGVIAREVADLRLMMSVVSGPDPRIPVPAVHHRPRVRLAGPADLTGLRVGWSPDLGLGVPVEPAVAEVVRAAVAGLEALGATVEEAAPDLADADEVFATTRAFDFAMSYGELYAQDPSGFKDALRWNIELGLGLTSADLRSAVAARGRLLASTTAFFDRFDVLAAPAVQVQPFDASLEYPTQVAGTPMATYLDWMRAATLVSATGLPALSVPAGFDRDGLPVGLQLVGPDGSDDFLLDVAGAFETAHPHHQRRPALGAAALR